jgi:hypothetical protein
MKPLNCVKILMDYFFIDRGLFKNLAPPGIWGYNGKEPAA